MLFLIAGSLRAVGKYTFADVVAYRLHQKPVRVSAAVGTIAVVLFYLIAQMVGAGKLIQLLFGLPYEWAIGIVGLVMMIYVLFGGMIATTWVQIIKAGLLLGGATLMMVLVLSKFGFNPLALFARAAELNNHPAIPDIGAAAKPALNVLGPTDHKPLDDLSLGLSLMIGTAGLPHILMRFYTVPDAAQARKSAFYATGLIAFFYLLTFILGFGVMVLVGQKNIAAVNPAYNMAAPMLADVIGGEPMLGFIAAVAFATILAVVAGLTLSGASALSHDLVGERVQRRRPAGSRATRGRAVRDTGLRSVGGVVGYRVQDNQRRVYGGTGLRGCGEREFPGAFPVDFLAAADDGRGGGEHVDAGGVGGRSDCHFACGLGGCSQTQGGDLPAQEPGAGDDPAVIRGGGGRVAARARTLGGNKLRGGPRTGRGRCGGRAVIRYEDLRFGISNLG